MSLGNLFSYQWGIKQGRGAFSLSEFKGYIDSNGEIGIGWHEGENQKWGTLLTIEQLEDLYLLTERMIDAKPFNGFTLFTNE
jgi:hypothetical protein